MSVQFYEKNWKNLKVVKERLNRPLTLSEKILFSHLVEPQNFSLQSRFLSLHPDRVIMQDATAQMAVLQFMLTGKKTSAVPTSIHCDHLILAKQGVSDDMKQALHTNKEVYKFLSTAASHYHIDFWQPGSGIIHQVVLENYAIPGSLIVGTDSHTPNAGGLGVLAIGVGGADATDVMAGLPWEVKTPKIIGVHLTGRLQGWASSKDVILKLLGILTVKGGTNKIIEYFGEGCSSISCTGKATITNMGAELGATSSIFPFDSKMMEYLLLTRRKEPAQTAEKYKNLLQADPEVQADPENYYDQVISIDLSKLEPYVSGPHSPDFVRPLSEFKEEIKKHKWPVELSACLIGSCTNSSYEDIGRAANVAEQARQKGLKMPQPFLVTPGSEQVKKTIERDGYMQVLNDVGAEVLANACGPCIGQWSRKLDKNTTNTILNSFNRNFPGRNDANPNTLSFIASPEVVLAAGLAGRLDFDPQTDEIKYQGSSFKFEPPTAPELPENFIFDDEGLQKPKGFKVKIEISDTSQRLQALQPFAAWDGKDFENLPVLCQAEGKCTTDHISPAGYWLAYRGHLDKISDNLLLGAKNRFTGEVGKGLNQFTNQRDAFSKVARDYKNQGVSWVIFGDENYGEGSSREHAAMTPRYLGAKAVIVKSFARIHETNLKKQGVLPCTFINPQDYDLVQETDRVSIKDLNKLAPNSKHALILSHKKAGQDKIFVTHSLNADQIEWFKQGSSLNVLRATQD